MLPQVRLVGKTLQSDGNKSSGLWHGERAAKAAGSLAEQEQYMSTAKQHSKALTALLKSCRNLLDTRICVLCILLGVVESVLL